MLAGCPPPATDQRGVTRPLGPRCDTGAFETTAHTLSGKVFEDVDYGGGAGRDLAGSGGTPVAGATVELYDGTGSFVSSGTTNGSGVYSLGVPNGSYSVRVVNDTVGSTRPGATGTEWPVQTYRTDASSGTAVAVTDRVGGEKPDEEDAPANSGRPDAG